MSARYEQELREQLRHTPWLVVSLLFHCLVAIVFANYRVELCREPGVIITSSPIPEPLPRLQTPEFEPEPTPIETYQTNFDDPELVEASLHEFSPERPVPPLRPLPQRIEPITGLGGGRHSSRCGVLGKGTEKGPTVTRQAIDQALTWLQRHQDPAGFWDCDEFATQCENNRCEGRGSALHDVGVTGLSVLAFVGAGHSHMDGPYRDTLRRALRYLKSVQDQHDGCFGSKTGTQFLYDHAIATLAMVECYYATREPLLRAPAQSGLDFVVRAQNPGEAWRYAVPGNGENDSSITGWMLFALYAGSDAGLDVDPVAIRDGMNYLERMTDPNSWRTGYLVRGSLPAREDEMHEDWPASESESLTAVAALARFFDGQTLENSPALRGAIHRIRQSPPRWNQSPSTVDYYYWYYGSYVMFQAAGKPWQEWQRSLLDTVVRHQRRDGDEAGSWDANVDPWGHRGGRVYATAINALCLEVYYRCDRLFGTR